MLRLRHTLMYKGHKRRTPAGYPLTTRDLARGQSLGSGLERSGGTRSCDSHRIVMSSERPTSVSKSSARRPDIAQLTNCTKKYLADWNALSSPLESLELILRESPPRNNDALLLTSVLDEVQRWMRSGVKLHQGEKGPTWHKSLRRVHNGLNSAHETLRCAMRDGHLDAQSDATSFFQELNALTGCTCEPQVTGERSESMTF
jgi:hypothetical protein